MHNKKAVLFLFALLLVSVSLAESITFWKGYVFIGGQPAASGTVVEAFVNNATLVANYTIGTIASGRDGYYIIPVVVATIDGGHNVSFRVNGVYPYTGANSSDASLQAVSSFGPNLLNISINLTANGGACRPYSGVTNATSYSHSGCSGGYCVHDLCRAASTYCGDGFCDSGESSSSCSADCGTTTTTGGGGGAATTTTAPANATTTVATTISTTTTTTIPAIVKVNLTADVPKTVEVNTTHVDKITITAAVNAPSVSVTVTEISKPAETPAPVTAAGSVYKYVEIKASNIAASSIAKAKISFKVAKSWISSEGIDKTTIALSRLVGSQWTKLVTVLASESATDITYEAESPGFSTFAITGNKVITTTSTAVPTTVPATTTTAPAKIDTTTIYLIVAVVIILLAAVAYFRLLGKKGRRQYIFMPEKKEGHVSKK
ncbi:MAG: PGF-pre-PGF domain-containing protein [Candidatus Aenigmarchaeota archaeon]|nr:PGF-pre-PGF domain-containing protein [Candidatus Aenigmarchaeota archaeon]